MPSFELFSYGILALLFAYCLRLKILPSNNTKLSKPTRNPTPRRNENTKLTRDIALYNTLQSSELHPSAPLLARTRLLELLDSTISTAIANPESTILSLGPRFNRTKLSAFLTTNTSHASAAFASYISRRRSGGPRELLHDTTHARYWLRLSTPVKLVDGSWVGSVHRANTPPSARLASRIAWQILSEELGDGDINKNHISIWQKLSADVPERGDARVWEAAVAQLALAAVDAKDWLPEILGFNMAYEALPAHMLIAMHELRELKMDPTYYLLHVAIDNGECGHAAMGEAAVEKIVLAAGGQEEQERMWRKVQAGFLLAEGLPTTPRKDILELGTTVARKAAAAEAMHFACPGKIGGKTLSEWMPPDNAEEKVWDFLEALQGSRWVVEGSPDQSRLVQEMKWGGRMFGAFTTEEVGSVERWIEGMVTPTSENVEKNRGAYLSFTKHKMPAPEIESATMPTLRDGPEIGWMDMVRMKPIGQLPNDPNLLGSLLIACTAPFERVPSQPLKCSSLRGMAAIRVLRTLHAFRDTNICSGMDEVRSHDEGLAEMGWNMGGGLENEIVKTVLGFSRRPDSWFDILVGVQLGLVVNVLWAGCWGEENRRMERIGEKVVEVLQDIWEGCRRDDLCKGFWTVRYEVGKCVVDAGGGEKASKEGDISDC